MLLTFKMIEAAFPRGIAELIWDYFGSWDTLEENACAGCWEECETGMAHPHVFRGAAAGGHLELMRNHLRRCVDTFGAFKCACEAKQDEAIEFLAPLVNCEDGLMSAILADRPDIAKTMLIRGAHNWSRAMSECAYRDRVQIIKLLVANGMPIANYFNMIISGNQPGMIAYALACGADPQSYITTYRGDSKLMVTKLLLRYKPKLELIKAIWIDACKFNRFDIIDFMLPRIETDAVTACMSFACANGLNNVVQRVFAHYSDRRWTPLFCQAAASGDQKTIDAFIERDYWTPDSGLLGAASELRLTAMADMLAKGATVVDDAFGEVCDKRARLVTCLLDPMVRDMVACYFAMRVLITHGACVCKKCGQPAIAHLE